LAASGLLSGIDRCGMIAGKTVWSTHQCLRGEVSQWCAIQI